MQAIVKIPPPNFALESIEPGENLPYRWRAKYFPSLIVESCVKNPTNRVFKIQTKIDMAKPRTEQTKFPSKLKLRILEPQESPTHELIWIRDSGKFAYYPYSNEFFAVFPGIDEGWLMLMISKRINMTAN